jgi:uncharacterized protein
MNSSLSKKYQNLKKLLTRIDSAVIAFSGGVDSSVLAKVAKDVMGDRVVAVTACSPTYPASELKEAKQFAKRIGIKHVVIKTNEFSDEKFLENSKNRCFWCKRELFLRLDKIREKLEFAFILDGANFTDKLDVRPGEIAKKEFSVKSPFFECGFIKDDIRLLARGLKLPVWAKPAQACLASRVPFGERITRERLKKIEAAEIILKSFFGVNSLVRARDHGVILRVETGKFEWTKLRKSGIKDVIARLKKIGYKYITLDLEGYIPAGKR